MILKMSGSWKHCVCGQTSYGSALLMLVFSKLIPSVVFYLVCRNELTWYTF